LLDQGEQYVLLKAQPKQKILSIFKRQKKIVRGFTEKEHGFEVQMDFVHIPLLNRLLVRGGVNVHAFIPRRSLEDLFLSFTENASQVKA
jgi:hypothetical protein